MTRAESESITIRRLLNPKKFKQKTERGQQLFNRCIAGTSTIEQAAQMLKDNNFSKRYSKFYSSSRNFEIALLNPHFLKNRSMTEIISLLPTSKRLRKLEPFFYL